MIKIVNIRPVPLKNIILRTLSLIQVEFDSFP